MFRRLRWLLFPPFVAVAMLAMAFPVLLLVENRGSVALAWCAGAAAAVVVALVGAWWTARQITGPLGHARRVLERYVQGDFSHRAPAPDPDELAALAEGINRLGAAMDSRIGELLRQRNEREAVLASMMEGVIAVDDEQRVIRLNEAGAELIGAAAEQALGQSLPAVVRNAPLQRLVDNVLERRESTADEIQLILHDGQRRVLHAQGSVLFDAADQPIGALVVLHDVTQLRRLESVRRDFVANVSHELRTPVTSIKGFVETLLDGAVHEPDNALRFLKIIEAQANRLGAIIEDLLTLSRIEQGPEKIEMSLETRPLRGVLEAAIQLCQPKAGQKQIRLELACESHLEARMNAVLMEQAVANLIDNAVKYSPAQREVLVEAFRSPGELVIRVQDHGCGIAWEHLPRIFERFYRVDKARSRQLGGTGLGLAIVKHIVQAHGGRTTVKSVPGEGSTFSIHLPA